MASFWNTERMWVSTVRSVITSLQSSKDSDHGFGGLTIRAQRGKRSPPSSGPYFGGAAVLDQQVAQHNAIDLYDRDAVNELARYIRDMLLSKGAA
jgi:hypothetical protein